MITLSLLQEGPAETTIYMIAGYALIFGVMVIYILSLWVRWRNLQRDQAVLQEMLPGEEAPAETSIETSNA